MFRRTSLTLKNNVIIVSVLNTIKACENFVTARGLFRGLPTGASYYAPTERGHTGSLNAIAASLVV